MKKDRKPKVTLENATTGDDVAVCMFDSLKGVKITFKFGVHDDEPEEVLTKWYFHISFLFITVYDILLFCRRV